MTSLEAKVFQSFDYVGLVVVSITVRLPAGVQALPQTPRGTPDVSLRTPHWAGLPPSDPPILLIAAPIEVDFVEGISFLLNQNAMWLAHEHARGIDIRTNRATKNTIGMQQ